MRKVASLWAILVLLPVSQGALLDAVKGSLVSIDTNLTLIESDLESPPKLTNYPKAWPKKLFVAPLHDFKASPEITTAEEAQIAITATVALLENINFLTLTQADLTSLQEEEVILDAIHTLLDTDKEIVAQLNDDTTYTFKVDLKKAQTRVGTSLALVDAQLVVGGGRGIPLNSPFFISFITLGGLSVIFVLFGFVCICVINSGGQGSKVKQTKKGRAKAQSHGYWIEPPVRNGQPDMRPLADPTTRSMSALEARNHAAFSHQLPPNHRVQRNVLLDRGYVRHNETSTDMY
eukprot:maker-scaffold1372_size44893-snap-gene-0.7 protein:Tk02468 transcript:maker-scaffold1372_size44893-snap-gene-0.7-mRNA-1 annotation:"glutamate-1-semialdehyde - chloroplastic-like"